MTRHIRPQSVRVGSNTSDPNLYGSAATPQTPICTGRQQHLRPQSVRVGNTSGTIIPQQRLYFFCKLKRAGAPRHHALLLPRRHREHPQQLHHAVVPRQLHQAAVPRQLHHAVVPQQLHHPVVPQQLHHPVVPQQLHHPVVPQQLHHAVVPQQLHPSWTFTTPASSSSTCLFILHLPLHPPTASSSSNCLFILHLPLHPPPSS
ncbi:hypothetical protein NQZ68_017749 [Dissostichus eleginoides]|nr:hypothetical protein NQZ68_017749 [Dissostichus eleginoides]